ncbi:uncharacterized protein LOC126687588 [Mercurialis annua]|uniref:uncharacterized protein LOC126687588 n=1 Tax=Mercurialis annua TaxID=3986 RepID=UPI0021607E1C|nr:uncharacterized protein LOC126687588 [Mercurialis annua]
MIGVWNMRGINNPSKQSEMVAFIKSYNFSILVIVETRVNMNKWEVVWSNLKINLVYIHCKIKSEDMNCCCNFVYGTYLADERVELWNQILDFSMVINDRWILLGDFNSVMNNRDKIDGNAIDEDRRDSFCDVQTPGVSEHSPLVIKMQTVREKRKMGFKFYTAWCEHQDFMDTVKKGWDVETNGCFIYKVYQKLKKTRRELKKLSEKDYSTISIRVVTMREILNKLQVDLQANPNNTNLMDEERDQRTTKKSIVRLKVNGSYIEDSEQLSKFFSDKLVNRRNANPVVFEKGYVVSSEENEMLNGNATEEEIKRALFSINESKAPRPDGFEKCFLKRWSVVGEDIIKAVIEFFNTGKMLKQANSTSISLILKVDVPDYINDYKPIACYNTTLYLRQNGDSCAMKADLHKAYDTIEWDFIEEVLMGLNVDNKFVKLVMNCIRSAMFSVQVNGKCCGYFQSARGLRQGNLISPLVFVLCMDYQSRSLDLNTMEGSGFKHHKSCKKMNLCHLAFADDLFLFSNEEALFISVVLMAVIKGVDEKCMRYLWHENKTKKGSLMNRDIVCSSQRGGGLGVKAIFMWNVAAVAMNIWN